MKRIRMIFSSILGLITTVKKFFLLNQIRYKILCCEILTMLARNRTGFNLRFCVSADDFLLLRTCDDDVGQVFGFSSLNVLQNTCLRL